MIQHFHKMTETGFLNKRPEFKYDVPDILNEKKKEILLTNIRDRSNTTHNFNAFQAPNSNALNNEKSLFNSSIFNQPEENINVKIPKNNPLCNLQLDLNTENK
jgi:hypothetical protein